ncbi:hypothetical protein [Sphingomonas sp. RS2018]
MTDSPDPIAFAPVATASTRHDGWTSDRQRAFIAALSEHGGVADAARSVGMTPQSANRLRRRPDATDFGKAWDAARENGRLKAFDEALRAAREGQRVPVTYAGRLKGYRLRIDNRLLFAACYGEPMSRYLR